METIDLKIQDTQAFVTLNRPHVLNAVNCELLEDLHSVLDELEAADRLRVITVVGHGRAFCTGIDLKALAAGEIQIGWFRRWEEALRRLEMLQAVTIACVQGYALGGGLQLAMACDLRIAVEEAQFGLPAVLEALIPGTGTWRLPRFVGLGRARRMMITGETVAGLEALEIGLIDYVVGEGELAQQAARLAEGVMHGSRTAQSLSKRLALMSFETPFDTFCNQYMDYQAQALQSVDHSAALARLRENAQKALKKLSAGDATA
jgi:enoyl-CoA hydratase/carnithine racemase